MSYELDFGNKLDEMLQQNCFTGFHEAGPNVDKILKEWTKEYEKIGGAGSAASANDFSTNLTVTIDKLPEMTERKKKIDMHFKIASHILTQIKARSLDKLQDIEDEIMTSQKLTGDNKQDYLSLISKAPDAANRKQCFLDKLRLIVIIILVMDDLELMQSCLQSIEAVHTEADEIESLSKVKIMLNKKKVSAYFNADSESRLFCKTTNRRPSNSLRIHFTDSRGRSPRCWRRA